MIDYLKSWRRLQSFQKNPYMKKVCFTLYIQQTPNN